MAISSNIMELEKAKFVESTEVANQAAVAVVNPDGTDLMGSGTVIGEVELEYNATPPTLADGASDSIQGDVNANLKITQATNNPGESQSLDTRFQTPKQVVNQATSYSVDFTSSALEASSVIKATPGRLGALLGRIDSSASSDDYYLQLIDATAVPADGAVTLLMHPIKYVHTTGTDTPIGVDLEPYGITSSNGLVWVISTTEFTKTIAGSVASITALYK